MKKSIVIIFVMLLAVVGGVMLLPAQNQTEQAQKPQASAAPSMPIAKKTTVMYNGKEGVDALTLLKESKTVEQNSSGLVTTIGGQKAEDSKREYWAFYVNGKMAIVGPADYVTKDTDKIEWKVENY